MRDADGLQGSPLLAGDGARLGTVRRLVLSAGRLEPRWLEVGLEGSEEVRLVPVEVASHDSSGALTIPYGAQSLRDSPQHRGDRVSDEQARRLDEHYGLTSPPAAP